MGYLSPSLKCLACANGIILSALKLKFQLKRCKTNGRYGFRLLSGTGKVLATTVSTSMAPDEELSSELPSSRSPALDFQVNKSKFLLRTYYCHGVQFHMKDQSGLVAGCDT